MTDTKRPSHDCPPPPDDPAAQPRPPGDGSTCQPIQETTPPYWDMPAPCLTDPACTCPPAATSDPICLDGLISQAVTDISMGEKAKGFKSELDALLTKAKAAMQEYTREQYNKLVKRWGEQDEKIAELVRKLDCAVPC